MTETMNAALMVGTKEPLEIRQVPIPEPEAGKVLVKIDVCGLCHTDLHFWLGEHELPRGLPAILGHEGVGRVVKLGPGVSRLKVGDRVGVGYVHGTCGNCRQCLTGHETHCASVECTGVNAEGCFADYAVLARRLGYGDPRQHWTHRKQRRCFAPALRPIALCARPPWSQVSWLSSSVRGAWDPMLFSWRKTLARGLPSVDVSDEKLSHAIEVGADYAIRADKDACAEINNLGGADASFNFAPVAASWRQMIEGAGPRSRLVLVSLPNQALTFDASEVIERGLQVKGSADGTRQELRQLMDLAALGRVRSVVERVPFADINNAFQRLAAGQVQGRLVIDMR